MVSKTIGNCSIRLVPAQYYVNNMVNYEEIIHLNKNGYSYNEISKMLNISKSTIAYYCNVKKQEERIQKHEDIIRKREEYESIVCDVVKKCTNLNQVCILLNKRPTNTNYDRIKYIIKKYNIDISHFNCCNIKTKKSHKLSFEEVFCENSKFQSNGHIKKKILDLGLKEHKCECCGLTEWNNKPIPLELHHVNGNRCDNRLENLQLLCPNCHTQTDNFCGKNIKNKTIKKTICKNCGIEFNKNGRIFCSDRCYEEYKQKKLNHPSKEELIDKFRELGSFTKIGEFYNVSDKAIIKWFKKYNLPFKAKEVRNYIISIYGKQPQWYNYLQDRDYSKSKEKLSKQVDVFDENHNFIGTFESINKASEFSGFSKISISRACYGKNLKNKKYFFKFH